MWFNEKHLQTNTQIKINDLYGYVLPHAGTSHTGHIISHTLRFIPNRKISKIIILYYPSSSTPNITINKDNIETNKDDTNTETTLSYFHEYYVPWKSLSYFFNDNTINYEGININTLIDKNTLNGKNILINKKKFITLKNSLNLEHTLLVVSADFSHFLPFDEAIELENKAAHSLLFRKLKSSPYIDIVDDVKTFKLLYKLLPNKYQLQWIGRTRSSGERGVGYLSFLIREKLNISQPVKNINHIKNNTQLSDNTKKKYLNEYQLPDGIFITAYDENMNTRECLGQWFDNQYKNKSWNTFIEDNLVKKVIRLAKTTSRLTGGQYIDIPVSFYTITYLYKDTKHKFIRGWHGILYNAFYLSDVFLENTFNNGSWIKNSDTKWQSGHNFDLTDTFTKLNSKAGISFINRTITPMTTLSNSSKLTKKKPILNTIHSNTKPYTLYSSKVSHFTIR